MKINRIRGGFGWVWPGLAGIVCLLLWALPVAAQSDPACDRAQINAAIAELQEKRAAEARIAPQFAGDGFEDGLRQLSEQCGEDLVESVLAEREAAQSAAEAPATAGDPIVSGIATIFSALAFLFLFLTT